MVEHDSHTSNEGVFCSSLIPIIAKREQYATAIKRFVRSFPNKNKKANLARYLDATNYYELHKFSATRESFI